LETVRIRAFSKNKNDDQKGNDKIENCTIKQFRESKAMVMIQNQQSGADNGEDGYTPIEVDLLKERHALYDTLILGLGQLKYKEILWGFWIAQKLHSQSYSTVVFLI